MMTIQPMANTFYQQCCVTRSGCGCCTCRHSEAYKHREYRKKRSCFDGPLHGRLFPDEIPQRRRIYTRVVEHDMADNIYFVFPN